jgi:site-specific DNA recombinase
LINTWTDEGKSAKNFDRPDWKKLEIFIKSNQVDYLIVTKYDRFSRNLSESLAKIEMLEIKYKIRIISVMEPIGVHPESPYYFKMRTDLLIGAHTERLVILDRTRFGINTAQKAGRFFNKAPIGYLNKRDDQNKPILVVDQIRAAIIQGIFSRFLKGESIQAVSEWARKEKGLKIKSRSGVRRILENITYAGLIKVSHFYDEQERTVKGIHEALISEADFFRVQNIIKNLNKPARTILNDEVPLRGKALCFCGRPLTAGRSKGKLKYVWYYKCHSHTENNLNARKLNESMESIFYNLSLPETWIQPIKDAYYKYLFDYGYAANEEKKELDMAIKSAEKKKNSMEEKYLDNKLDYETYFKWKGQLESELFDLRDQRSKIGDDPQDYADLDSLMNMGEIYKMASTSDKQALVGGVFNNLLYYQDKTWRTPYMLGVFSSKSLILRQKGLLFYEKPLAETSLVSFGSGSETAVEHLIPFLKLLSKIKQAA